MPAGGDCLFDLGGGEQDSPDSFGAEMDTGGRPHVTRVSSGDSLALDGDISEPLMGWYDSDDNEGDGDGEDGGCEDKNRQASIL